MLSKRLPFLSQTPNSLKMSFLFLFIQVQIGRFHEDTVLHSRQANTQLPTLQEVLCCLTPKLNNQTYTICSSAKLASKLLE